MIFDIMWRALLAVLLLNAAPVFAAETEEYPPQAETLSVLPLPVASLERPETCLVAGQGFDHWMEIHDLMGLPDRCATIYYRVKLDPNDVQLPYEKFRMDDDIMLVLQFEEEVEGQGALPDVLASKFDESLKRLFELIRERGQPIALRIGPEANSYWKTVGVYRGRNKPWMYPEAFAKIGNLFLDVAGFDLLRFIDWDANQESFAKQSDGKVVSLGTSDYEELYPRKFCEKLKGLGKPCIGSNPAYERAGTSPDHTVVYSFVQKVGPSLQKLRSLGLDPAVAELGAAGIETDKVAWFADALRYPGLVEVHFLCEPKEIGEVSNTVPVSWCFEDVDGNIDSKGAARFREMIGAWLAEWGEEQQQGAIEPPAHRSGLSFLSIPAPEITVSAYFRGDYFLKNTRNEAINSVTGEPYGAPNVVGRGALNLDFDWEVTEDVTTGFRLKFGGVGTDARQQSWNNKLTFGGELRVACFSGFADSGHLCGGLGLYHDEFLDPSVTPDRFNQTWFGGAGDNYGGVFVEWSYQKKLN